MGGGTGGKLDLNNNNFVYAINRIGLYLGGLYLPCHAPSGIS